MAKWLIILCTLWIPVVGIAQNQPFSDVKGTQLRLSIVRSPDQLSELIIHTDEDAFGLNSYFPETDIWLKRNRAAQGRSFIEGADFIEDPELLAEKLNQDPCVAKIAAQFRSGQFSKRLNERIEQQFEDYALEEGLLKVASSDRGESTIKWSVRGPILMQIPKIKKAYVETKSHKRLVIDYLRTENHFNLKLHFVFPELETYRNEKVEYWPGREIEIKNNLSSCLIRDQDLDGLAWQYFLKLRTNTLY